MYRTMCRGRPSLESSRSRRVTDSDFRDGMRWKWSDARQHQLIRRSPARPPDPSSEQSVSRPVSWSVGRSVGCLVGLSLRRSAGRSRDYAKLGVGAASCLSLSLCTEDGRGEFDRHERRVFSARLDPASRSVSRSLARLVGPPLKSARSPPGSRASSLSLANTMSHTPRSGESTGESEAGTVRSKPAPSAGIEYSMTPLTWVASRQHKSADGDLFFLSG